MFVCMSVDMWRASGSPNPCTDLDKVLHGHPHLSKEGFGAVLTPASSPWACGAWNPKSFRTHFWKLFTKQKCQAGYKLSWAATGTSANIQYNKKMLKINQKSYFFFSRYFIVLLCITFHILTWKISIYIQDLISIKDKIRS